MEMVALPHFLQCVLMEQAAQGDDSLGGTIAFPRNEGSACATSIHPFSVLFPAQPSGPTVPKPPPLLHLALLLCVP